MNLLNLIPNFLQIFSGVSITKYIIIVLFIISISSLILFKYKSMQTEILILNNNLINITNQRDEFEKQTKQFADDIKNKTSIILGLQTQILNNKKACDEYTKQINNRYKILLNSKQVAPSEIKGGVIDEKTSDDLINLYNSHIK